MYLVQTVQTSWRPQLPLPKEISNNCLRSPEMEKHSQKKSDTSKWSLGRLFKKKKGQEAESTSEEDRKAGFSPTQIKTRRKEKNQKNSSRAGFDHIVVNPTKETNYKMYRSSQLTPTYQNDYRSALSLDRKSIRSKAVNDNNSKCHSSSEEEKMSMDLSSAKYRSDESLGSAGGTASVNSRRSRSARTERYYKRLSRDGEGTPHLQIAPPVPTPPVHRYRTQPVPLSIYNGNVHQITYANLNHQPQPNLQNSMNNNKRSISYDNYINLHNLRRQNHVEPQIKTNGLPPPPPPRDPLRRVQLRSSQNDIGPASYNRMYSKNRCVSDDKLWGTTESQRNIIPQNRRFIKRSDRDVSTENKPLDFTYMTESTPRSRKPISILDSPDPEYVNSPIRTSKSGLAPSSESKAPDLKPRSSSSTRAGELRGQRLSLYTNVSKSLNAKSVDQVDNIVHGSLIIKPKSKSQSMPNYYQNNVMPPPSTRMDAHKKVRDILTKNKYSPEPADKLAIKTIPVHDSIGNNNRILIPENKFEEIAKREALSNFSSKKVDELIKKETNLEDAINELEAIYKSLNLVEVDGEAVPDFDAYAARADEFLEDEDSPAGEPDIVLDDVAYRNIRHANSMLKTPDKQPPFGIPILPIAPSPRSDYLKVPKPEKVEKLRDSPDIIVDDLAVRTLRKDSSCRKKNIYFECPKKRAVRTQSANIYNLIQRDAAKPSGGNLNDYFGSNRQKAIERSGSLSDLYKDFKDEVPSPLELLKALNAKDESPRQQIPFRHPSQGGAIMNLPNVLQTEEKQKQPIPLPRKSCTPETDRNKLMEDALNQIAREAKESSEKLSRDLEELRLCTSTIQQEALCGKIVESPPESENRENLLNNNLPNIEDCKKPAEKIVNVIDESQESQQVGKRNEKHLLTIDQVSKEANKVCDKIMQEIVTKASEPQSPKSVDLVIPLFLQKLDPSSLKIGEIAARCMRQISELDDDTIPDYDNINAACNNNKIDVCDQKHQIEPLLIVAGPKPENTEEKDAEEDSIEKIMKECEDQVKLEQRKTSDISGGTETTGEIFFSLEDRTSFTSSSDCIKSSSPSQNRNDRRQQSSSITSFNPYSSSDYIKSPSSEFYNNSTDPIKTFSTTSYDVQSSNSLITPNQFTNSPYSSPSPPLQPHKNQSSSPSTPSQYNSTEELAAIFKSPNGSVLVTGNDDNNSGANINQSCCDFAANQHENSKCIIKTSSKYTVRSVSFNLDTIHENLDDYDENCESLDEASELVRPNFSSTISIVVLSPDGTECPTQLDSLTSNEEESNPDSGNVSLSEFPVQNRFEVAQNHNRRSEVVNRVSRYVNEILIPPSRPSTSSSSGIKPTNALTLFAQPPSQNRGLTFLENLALACTIGLINNNDIFTLVAIIAAIVTIFSLMVM